jgi:hypothetical protein
VTSSEWPACGSFSAASASSSSGPNCAMRRRRRTPAPRASGSSRALTTLLLAVRWTHSRAGKLSPASAEASGVSFGRKMVSECSPGGDNTWSDDSNVLRSMPCSVCTLLLVGNWPADAASNRESWTCKLCSWPLARRLNGALLGLSERLCMWRVRRGRPAWGVPPAGGGTGMSSTGKSDTAALLRASAMVDSCFLESAGPHPRGGV